eukprot:g596.t1
MAAKNAVAIARRNFADDADFDDGDDDVYDFESWQQVAAPRGRSGYVNDLAIGQENESVATFRRKLARTASPPPPPPNLASKPTMVGGRKPGQPPGKRKQRPANLNLKPDGGAHLKATSPAEGYNVGGTPLHGSGTNGFGDEDDGSDMEFERPPSDRQQTLLQSVPSPTNASLHQHKQRNASKPGQLVCPRCGRTDFSSKAELNKHAVRCEGGTEHAAKKPMRPPPRIGGFGFGRVGMLMQIRKEEQAYAQRKAEEAEAAAREAERLQKEKEEEERRKQEVEAQQRKLLSSLRDAIASNDKTSLEALLKERDAMQGQGWSAEGKELFREAIDLKKQLDEVEELKRQVEEARKKKELEEKRRQEEELRLAEERRKRILEFENEDSDSEDEDSEAVQARRAQFLKRMEDRKLREGGKQGRGVGVRDRKDVAQGAAGLGMKAHLKAKAGHADRLSKADAEIEAEKKRIEELQHVIARAKEQRELDLKAKAEKEEAAQRTKELLEAQRAELEKAALAATEKEKKASREREKELREQAEKEAASKLEAERRAKELEESMTEQHAQLETKLAVAKKDAEDARLELVAQTEAAKKRAAEQEAAVRRHTEDMVEKEKKMQEDMAKMLEERKKELEAMKGAEMEAAKKAMEAERSQQQSAIEKLRAENESVVALARKEAEDMKIALGKKQDVIQEQERKMKEDYEKLRLSLLKESEDTKKEIAEARTREEQHLREQREAIINNLKSSEVELMQKRGELEDALRKSEEEAKKFAERVEEAERREEALIQSKENAMRELADREDQLRRMEERAQQSASKIREEAVMLAEKTKKEADELATRADDIAEKMQRARKVENELSEMQKRHQLAAEAAAEELRQREDALRKMEAEMKQQQQQRAAELETKRREEKLAEDRLKKQAEELKEREARLALREDVLKKEARANEEQGKLLSEKEKLIAILQRSQDLERSKAANRAKEEVALLEAKAEDMKRKEAELKAALNRRRDEEVAELEARAASLKKREEDLAIMESQRREAEEHKKSAQLEEVSRLEQRMQELRAKEKELADRELERQLSEKHEETTENYAEEYAGEENYQYTSEDMRVYLRSFFSPYDAMGTSRITAGDFLSALLSLPEGPSEDVAKQLVDSMSAGGTELINYEDFIKNYVAEMGLPEPTYPCEYCAAHVGAPIAHYAATYGHLECLEAVLDDGSVLHHSVDENGRTALFCAATNNSFSCVAAILQRVDTGGEPNPVLDVQDVNGDSAAHACACSGYIDCLKLLLQAGANPNLQNRKGHLPAHICADSKCMSTLMEFGGDLFALDHTGRTCMFTSATHGREQCLGFLLDVDEDAVLLNFQDSRGDTPLHGAACNGHYACVEMLLQTAATPDITNAAGFLPGYLAECNGHQRCVDLLVDYGGYERQLQAPVHTDANHDSGAAETSNDVNVASNWSEAIDPESGHPYYYNTVSGETSWEKPEGYDEWCAQWNEYYGQGSDAAVSHGQSDSVGQSSDGTGGGHIVQRKMNKDYIKMAQTYAALEPYRRLAMGMGGEGATCILCSSNLSTEILLPCEHSCICSSCIDQYGYGRRPSQGKKHPACPACRRTVYKVVKLEKFLSLARDYGPAPKLKDEFKASFSSSAKLIEEKYR